MTDEELVKCLKHAALKRDGFDAVYLASPAAERIEALIADRDSLKSAQIDAIRVALEAAAEVCAGIRQRISKGPMPEGARFDYEQAILALDPSAIAAKLGGYSDER